MNCQAGFETFRWTFKGSVLGPPALACQGLDPIFDLQITFGDYPQCCTFFYVELMVDCRLLYRPLGWVCRDYTSDALEIIAHLEGAAAPAHARNGWVPSTIGQ